MAWGHSRSGCWFTVALGTIACGGISDDPPDARPAPGVVRERATIIDGFDITLKSEILRQSGGVEFVGEDEVFLVPDDRARFLVTVQNRSDGWAPVNFELCVDHPEELKVVNPYEGEFWTNRPLDPPCAVRYRDGSWPVVEQGKDVEYVVGAVLAVAPSGGYVTIVFRVEFEKSGALDLYEYTVPYRIIPTPSGELLPRLPWATRWAVKRWIGPLRASR